jgi:hypothetical protein
LPTSRSLNLGLWPVENITAESASMRKKIYGE